MNETISRRSAFKTTAAGALFGTVMAAVEQNVAAADLKGNINHSVCKWCYRKIPLEKFCQEANRIGLKSVELLNPPDFPMLNKYDLHCAMVSFPQGKTPRGVKVGGITRAFNRIEHHDTLLEIYEPHIKASANAGFRNVICFSGNRNGLDDEQGIKNCAIGLKRMMKLAEKYDVTITMELLNSKVNHKDYQCDQTEWGVELCKAIGSERFKLLYDIYHMQIMEGDVIATIKKHNQYFSHYHTGGVPGRNEIDDSQELYYPAICKAIKETGFKGFIAQEFIPKRKDQIASLEQGVGICDV
ncbi:MAG: hydroxypyruvate isomerase [Verrucomicrobiales bacterium]|nr:hydroxypyruvate isomerase [Verrucomicrobiales bacterium]|tara:strand:- start:1023 stop:1919 length:897 start_codon:yes stop_codon:yes gene_type:complete